MHELGREGELRGTTDQISRLARCQPADLREALTDLAANKAAIAEERNGGWLIICRRMKKAFDISQVRRLAGSKNGAKHKQTLDIDIEDDSGDKKSRKDRAQDLAEVQAFCKEIGLHRTDAEWFWHKCEANGWTNGGKRILDWRQTLRSWKAGGYVPSIKNPPRGRPPGARIEPPKAKTRTEPPPLVDPIKEADFQRRLAEWKAAGRPLGSFPT